MSELAPTEAQPVWHLSPDGWLPQWTLRIHRLYPTLQIAARSADAETNLMQGLTGATKGR